MTFKQFKRQLKALGVSDASVLTQIRVKLEDGTVVEIGPAPFPCYSPSPFYSYGTGTNPLECLPVTSGYSQVVESETCEPEKTLLCG